MLWRTRCALGDRDILFANATGAPRPTRYPGAISAGPPGLLERDRRVPRTRHSHRPALGTRRGSARSSTPAREARVGLRVPGRTVELVGEPSDAVGGGHRYATRGRCRNAEAFQPRRSYRQHCSGRPGCSRTVGAARTLDMHFRPTHRCSASPQPQGRPPGRRFRQTVAWWRMHPTEVRISAARR